MPPQRLYAGSPSTRRSLKLLVAVQLDQPTVVVVLTGSDWAKCPDLRTYHTAAGSMAQRMTAQEYCDALAIVLAGRIKAAGMPTRSTTVFVWHDRDPVHRAFATMQWMMHNRVQPILLPPRSPDLDPLDYAVFGRAKRDLRQLEKENALDWDAKCNAFIRLLEGTQHTNAAIEGLARRVAACIKVEGRHIEEELHRLRAMDE
jgi:hypothetical protein